MNFGDRGNGTGNETPTKRPIASAYSSATRLNPLNTVSGALVLCLEADQRPVQRSRAIDQVTDAVSARASSAKGVPSSLVTSRRSAVTTTVRCRSASAR